MSTSEVTSSPDARVLETARTRLGYDELRPGQPEAIAALLAGHDTLAVLPTGAGKSAIYQVAGALTPGVTVVVSPLIALQRDQVDALAEVDAGKAVEINSALPGSIRDDVFDRLRHQQIEFVFLAPEQFSNEETMAGVRAARPSLFVVDEAHCISEWGYDFRPDYLTLGRVIEELGHPTTLALTATAAPPVRDAILERLGMADPVVIVRGFDRPNIHLAVRTFDDEAEKRNALLDAVMSSPKPGLVYGATRRETEELAAQLVERGCIAAAYHAGLPASVREAVQDQFMGGELEVVVATVAFGMGIDKPDIRFVYHADVSESVDAYYQEIGRAGRDGEPANAILFYRPDDLNLRHFQSGLGQLDLDQTKRVAELVTLAGGPVGIRELSDVTNLTNTKLMTTLRRLDEAGAVEVRSSEEVAPANGAINPEAAARDAVEMQRKLGLYARSRVEMMRQYAESRGCRRAFILNYFGEASGPVCANCDTCDAGEAEAVARADEPYPVGSEVIHASWGAGQVMRYEGETVTVLFESVGYRTLSLELVQTEHLLNPSEPGDARREVAD